MKLLNVLLVLLGVLLFQFCKKDGPTNSGGSAPQAPTLSTPANSSTNIAIPPTLTWNASTGAMSYTLQVSTSSSFTSFEYNRSGLTSTSQQVAGLINSTTYYWRVNATNDNGTSGWSSYWNFTTGFPPPVPTLISPLNNTTNVSLPPTLTWNASTGAMSYTLQVSTSSSFTSFEYNQDGLTTASQPVSGLNNSTLYYWRVSATNSYGTSGWSTVWIFTTASGTTGIPCPGTPTVTYEGKTYNTVQLGTQCWLKENLDVGTRIDGSQSQANNNTIEKYCYNNDTNNCNMYGGLYVWGEAMQYSSTAVTRGICPTSWHIPTLAECQILSTTVGGDGNALKAIGQGIGVGAGTNTSGFSALLSGYRDPWGPFYDVGGSANIWTSTRYITVVAYWLRLTVYDVGIDLRMYVPTGYGSSVRCVKD